MVCANHHKQGSVLVTGIGGFVGRHLCKTLLDEGYDICGTVLLPEHAEGLPENVICLTCDLTKEKQIQQVLGDVRPLLIFHLAAQSHVPTAWKNPAATFRTNVFGTLNLFESVYKENLVCRILSVCSAEEYGKISPNEIPVKEDHPLNPQNPYAVSKAAQDMLSYQWSLSPGLDIVRVRAFNHTGPGQSSDFVCSAFARQAAAISLGLQPPEIRVGNVNVRRDFLDVRDVCRAYLRLLRYGQKGEVYNVASRRPRSIKTILHQLLQMVGKPVKVIEDPELIRPVETPIVCGDTKRIVKDTGWHSKMPFKQTLKDLFNWWVEKLKK